MKEQPNPVPNFFLASAADFKKIPGSPIAYWVSERFRKTFQLGKPLHSIAPARLGMTSSDNNRFVRHWYEVGNSKMGLNFGSEKDSISSGKKWFPYNKGGDFRRWYGNNINVINWQNGGEEVLEYAALLYGSPTRTIRNIKYFFKPAITWTFVSSSSFGVRSNEAGYIFDVGGSSAFPPAEDFWYLLGLLASRLSFEYLKTVNPTLNFQAGNVGSIPVIGASSQNKKIIDENVKTAVGLVKADWDSYETSWDFSRLPILPPDHHLPTLKATYDKVRAHWQSMTLEMQQLEEENNRIFIDAYGLQDELTPEVPLPEITLTCNPHYRYKGNKTEEELETLLRTDTIKELISYAIGCMMGRYRLDVPGLIYAHGGNKNFDEIYHRRGGSVCPPGEPISSSDGPACPPDIDRPESGRHTGLPLQKDPLRSLRLCGEFLPDDDGIVPIMDLAWFPDDAANRFVEFIKVAWPPEHLDENLKFVADNLNPKKNEDTIDTIRRYLSTRFFKDHLKTYKKRPIYWLFSSGKQKTFECLVYLHRYNETTLSRMRSAYVTPLQGNIRARIEFLTSEKDAATSASDQRKYQKEIEALKKKQTELSKFDDELRHYADMKISLDLDDGVKVNYGKFGNLLSETKAITGK